jgi:hypothetical protein
MKVQKIVSLNLVKKRTVPKIYLVQYDTGIQLVMTVADFQLPDGTTAALYVQKPSGKFVYQESGISVSGSTITVDLENQAITEHGTVPYQLRIENGTDLISTFSGILEVEKSLADAHAVESTSVVSAFDEITDAKLAYFRNAIDSAGVNALASIASAEAEVLKEIEESGGVTDARLHETLGNYLNEHPAHGLNTNTKNILLYLFRSAVYTADVSEVIEMLEEMWYEDVTEVYSITNNLTDVINSNAEISIGAGKTYTATLTPAVENYVLDTVTVTMGGEDVTASVYADGEINIPIVTGAIIITATVKEQLYLYRLENRTFDGTSASVIDTGIELLATDSDFTIMIDAEQGDITPFVTGTVNCAIFACTQSTDPWNGIFLQTNSVGKVLTKWMSVLGESITCNVKGCRIKAVVTHAKGSGKATYKVKIDDNAVTEIIITEAFTPVVRKFGIGGSNTGGNPWVGTMNSFTIYNTVKDDATISAFLA